jgi:intein/homing endonuclease
MGEKQLRKRVESVLDRWGLNTWGNDDTYMGTTCTALGRRLAKTCGRGAENKRIPGFLWTAPRPFQEGFISGYFSGDGTVNGGEICATTTSREMAEGMVFLLGSMGVRASYRTYEIDREERYLDQHLIKVYQEGIENFPVLALTRKQKRAQKIKAEETKISRDRIPVPKGLKTEVVRAMKSADLSHSIYETGYSSRPRLKQAYGDLPDRMQALVQAPVWWEVVDSVEQIGPTQRAYDLGMQQRSNFMMSGGLLAHSTS